jgi:beta-glucosidase
VIPLLGAFESTYLPAHDTDVAETSGHVVRRRSDLALLRSCGVTQLRYPIRWHRVETVRGRFDWRDTDEVMSLLADDGWHPIVDLVHHTSIPRWLDGGFGDPRFADAYLRYVTEFAERYPWVESYTLFNEPFSTLFLCGH